MQIRFVTLMTAMALTLFAPAAILAHSGATGVVKERMEAMKEIGESTGDCPDGDRNIPV